MGVDFSDWKVTPRHMLSDFSLPLSLDQKITIFFERVDGWQLATADQIINGVKDDDGKIIKDPVPDSDYAVLHIVFSFFEMIAKYRDGATRKSSNRFFGKGVTSVFSHELDKYPQHLVDRLLDSLYRGTRCGLYHCGFTDVGVFIKSDIGGAIALTKQGKIIIDPHILVRELRKYLGRYVEQLRDVHNTNLRRNFEKRFDFDNALVKKKMV